MEKADIPLLIDALRMPPEFVCGNGIVCHATEGLCIPLKRFAFPCHYSDMKPFFGRSVPELSIISNESPTGYILTMATELLTGIMTF